MAQIGHPGDLARAEEDVRESFTTGKLQTEFRAVWPDGSVRWLEARAIVSRDGDGKPVRMVGINMDITERKQAEEALRDADRRKDEFLATLAHEIRNPLAPLRNGLQVIKLARGDGETVERTRAMMERQVGQMVRLIDDLLDLSRIRQGKVELRRERVELGVALNNAVETSRPLIEARRAPPDDHGAPRPDLCGRRPDPAGTGLHEPPHQCRQVHGGGRSRHAEGRAARQ